MGSVGRFSMNQRVYGLDNSADTVNIGPTDRNTEPAIGRSPSPRADEDIFSTGIDQGCVDFANLPVLFQLCAQGRKTRVLHTQYPPSRYLWYCPAPDGKHKMPGFGHDPKCPPPASPPGNPWDAIAGRQTAHWPSNLRKNRWRIPSPPDTRALHGPVPASP